MYWPALADQLIARGHDVSAAVVRPELRALPDVELFAAAQIERRAVVTENVADFIPVVRRYASVNRHHHGLVLVAPSGYPRDRAHRDVTFGRLVTALDAMLRAKPDVAADPLVCWLTDPRRITPRSTPG